MGERKMPDNGTKCSLDVPRCCELRPVGIVWKCTPTVSDLREIGNVLAGYERGSPWWHGDLLNAVHESGNAFDAAAVVADLAAATELGSQAIISRRRVAAFYPLEKRVRGTTFAHHHEAIVTGNLGVALEWLARASSEKWTTTDLRSALRAASITAPKAITPEARDIARVNDWAKARMPDVECVSARDARQLLAHLDAPCALVDMLRARAR